MTRAQRKRALDTLAWWRRMTESDAATFATARLTAEWAYGFARAMAILGEAELEREARNLERESLEGFGHE